MSMADVGADFGVCGGGAVGMSGGMAAALQFFAASQCLLTENWPPQADLTDRSTFDFVVVGGGTAGATIAARLSEVPSFSVLLLEAGGDPPQESIVPAYKDTMKNSKYDWNFTSVNDGSLSQAFQYGQQRQPRGKVLGGSGTINDMVYSRGSPVDYEEWASLVGPDWSWSNVLEYFMKTEDMTDERIVNNPELMKYHAQGGAIRVTGRNQSTHMVDKMLESFKELGYNIVEDMTYPHKIGAGRFSHTIRDGQRDSSLTALLNRAANRPNLFVLKNTEVTKIIIEDKIARGVTAVSSNGTELTFYANKEVILCAGTFNTPKLLLLSGIGPKEHLDAMGIETIVNLPVGENLQDHIMVPVYLAADKGTCVTDEADKHMETIRYLYDRTGALADTGSMGAYYTLNRSKDRNVPDFGIYPSCTPIGSSFEQGCSNVLGYKESVCRQLAAVNEQKELISLMVVLLKPKSRGRVRLQSKNPWDYPSIFTGTFTDQDDLESFPEAMLSAMSVASTSYLSGLRADVVRVDLEECSPPQLTCYCRAMAAPAWHASGTAAMGTVVGGRLQVRGVEGLRAGDASVMPAVVRGNTNAPVVMIAEKAAQFIKELYLMESDTNDV